MGHRKEDCPDLPVSLLMVLHPLWLECEKSMELIASPLLVEQLKQKRSSFFRVNPIWGSEKGAKMSLALFLPTWHIDLATAT